MAITWAWDASISTDVSHYIIQVAFTASLLWADVGVTTGLSIDYDPLVAEGEVAYITVIAVNEAGNRGER